MSRLPGLPKSYDTVLEGIFGTLNWVQSAVLAFSHDVARPWIPEEELARYGGWNAKRTLEVDSCAARRSRIMRRLCFGK